MAGSSKDRRSERDAQSLIGDLLRRATSPEVLAGVAGAAAAARFTKHMVEDSDETEAEDQPEETEEAQAAGEDEPDEDEDRPGDDEREDSHAEEEEADEDERDEPIADEAEENELDDEEDAEEPHADEEEVSEAAAEPDSDGDGEGDAHSPQDGDDDEREETSDSSATSDGSLGTDDERLGILDQARRYAEQLTGHEVEGFSSLEQDDRGWRIGLEVVELSRVPSTTDVLGSYELVLSDDGEFVDFRRAHRYYRNSTDGASS
jgi:Gas vesicle synthesis protein GvpO